MTFNRQAGNVTLLIVYQCILILVVAVVSLDIVSVLFIRRAVRTAADSAALGAMRVIQNEVGPLLWAKADQKVRTWLQQAKDRWETAAQQWGDDYSRARDDCKTSNTGENGELDQSQYDVCISTWKDANPQPKLPSYERVELAAHVKEPDVVETLLGHNNAVPIADVVKALLSAQDQMCVLLDNRALLESRGRVEAMKYAERNDASLESIDVPYDGQPQVFVRVKRDVPTMFFARLSGENLSAIGEVGATLLDLSDKSIPPGAC